jgi:nucleotide-binding universal stress UspA family protein
MPPTAVLDRPTDQATATPGAGPEALAPALTPAPESIGGRRGPARLLVAVDGSASSTRQLIWALQEAARREALVLAVAVVDTDADTDTRTATHILLDAELQHAIGQTGVHGRSHTTLVDPLLYEALTGAAGGAGGADLVVVRPHHKTVLRPALPRPAARRPLAHLT